jgi:hypothetical protein
MPLLTLGPLNFLHTQDHCLIRTFSVSLRRCYLGQQKESSINLKHSRPIVAVWKQLS